MSHLIDETGNTYGYLTVLGLDQKSTKKAKWLCRCLCGNYTSVVGVQLRNGKSRSCGQCVYHKKILTESMGIDLTGKRFGRLTVLEFGYKKGYMRYWKCLCDCGTEKYILGNHMSQGRIVSCGCHKREMTSKVNRLELEGQKFGTLTVIKRDHVNSQGWVWLCRCDCDNTRLVNGKRLKFGDVLRCKECHTKLIKEKCTTHGLTGTKEFQDAHREIRRERKELLDSNWSPVMEKALRKLQPICVVCGSKRKMCTDHVLPLSKGYGLEPGNAVRLCDKCNKFKFTRVPDDLPPEMRDKILAAAEDFKIAWEEGYRG